VSPLSTIYAVQTWRQLAAVAEPPSGFGRILIIASAGVEPRRGRRNRHHPRWAVTVSAVPDRESADVGRLQNTPSRQLGHPSQRDNPCHHAARSRVHLRQRPEGQLQKANVPPDQAGCDSENQRRRRLPRCAPCGGWSRSSPSSPCSSSDLSPPSRLGEPSPNWPPVIPHRQLPADPPGPLSSMPASPRRRTNSSEVTPRTGVSATSAGPRSGV
jgi:hypothetical protein